MLITPHHHHIIFKTKHSQKKQQDNKPINAWIKWLTMSKFWIPNVRSKGSSRGNNGPKATNNGLIIICTRRRYCCFLLLVQWRGNNRGFFPVYSWSWTFCKIWFSSSAQPSCAARATSVSWQSPPRNTSRVLSSSPYWNPTCNRKYTKKAMDFDQLWNVPLWNLAVPIKAIKARQPFRPQDRGWSCNKWRETAPTTPGARTDALLRRCPRSAPSCTPRNRLFA